MRPLIPAEIKRAVLIEAGHRCAVPTCGSTTVEVHHITPWSECKSHNLANLIALCPTCHSRVHRGEIDRKSVLIYKQKLTEYEIRQAPQETGRNANGDYHISPDGALTCISQVKLVADMMIVFPAAFRFLPIVALYPQGVASIVSIREGSMQLEKGKDRGISTEIKYVALGRWS